MSVEIRQNKITLIGIDSRIEYPHPKIGFREDYVFVELWDGYGGNAAEPTHLAVDDFLEFADAVREMRGKGKS
jgi:hypothetical protein